MLGASPIQINLSSGAMILSYAKDNFFGGENYRMGLDVLPAGTLKGSLPNAMLNVRFAEGQWKKADQPTLVNADADETLPIQVMNLNGDEVASIALPTSKGLTRLP